jgi:hypothetical protein
MDNYDTGSSRPMWVGIALLIVAEVAFIAYLIIEVIA